MVVGILEGELFRWDARSGARKLGKLPGSVGGDDAQGMSVSEAGHTIVGWNGNGCFGTPFRAFVWGRARAR